MDFWALIILFQENQDNFEAMLYFYVTWTLRRFVQLSKALSGLLEDLKILALELSAQPF